MARRVDRPRYRLPRLFRAAFLFAVLLLTLLCAVEAVGAADAADWNGTWNTRWRDGGDRLVLKQDGEKVSGSYTIFKGTIDGRVDGRRLTGTWSHDGISGGFLFVQSRDGKTFAGRFRSGAWWTGERADGANPYEALDQSTPLSTMQSFLRAFYGAETGSMDYLGRAASLVIPDGDVGNRLGVLDYTRLLYSVIDGFTFDLLTFPRDPAAENASVVLGQAGSDVAMTLAFRRVGDRWYIAAPSIETLRKTLDAEHAARGGDRDVDDPAALRSPRDTFKLFLSGMKQAGDSANNPAYTTLNTSELRSVARRQEIPLYARYLREVIDRVGYIYWQEIPDDPNSRTPYVHFQHPAGEIVVAPYNSGKDSVVWQFTPDTLRTIRAVYAAIDDLPLPAGLDGVRNEDAYFTIRDFLRGTFPSLLTPFGPMERWQWLALFGLAVAGLAAGLLLSRLARLIAPHRFSSGVARQAADRLVGGVLSGAIVAMVLGLMLVASVSLLGLPDTAAAVMATVAWLLIVIGLIPISWEVMTSLLNAYRRGRTIAGHHETLISLSLGVARLVLVVVAALLLAQELDVPYQGVIAGLGIGGLAMALAVQPVLQNFLSGFILYADHPLAVGDFCRFGDKLGTVEHVGMRSTRIRSLDRTLITIPNAEFANMQLENFASRDRMWLKTTLQLRCETTPDQLRFVLTELRKLLIAHPMILSEPMHVRFLGFGEYSLDIEVFAYVSTSDYEEFLAVREDVFLRVMNLIEECGAQFAFPSEVHYHAEDAAADAGRIEAAEEKVAAWRREGRLPFPDLDWQDKAELRNTLDYPPNGPDAAPTPLAPATRSKAKARATGR